MRRPALSAYGPVVAQFAPVAAPVVMPAALTPVAPAPADEAPQPRRVSYAAESFYSFDQSELRAGGMSALDAFARDLSGARYEMITVQGHADRLGSVEYNQTLSLARTEAVKGYLVGTGKLDAQRISAVGKSESEPVTLPADCMGPMSAMVIQCLQPDRRVNIEVRGSR